MDKFIKLSELYRIVDKYGLKRDIRAKEEIQENALEAKEDVKGEWIHCGNDEWFCSECGNFISTEGSWERPSQKFCDECGADMRGGNAIHE